MHTTSDTTNQADSSDYYTDFADFPLLSAREEHDTDLRKWVAVRACMRLLASESCGRDLLTHFCETCLLRPPAPEDFPNRSTYYHLRKDITDMLPGKPGADGLTVLLAQLKLDKGVIPVASSLTNMNWPATLVIGLATIRLRQLGIDYRDKMADALLMWLDLPSPPALSVDRAMAHNINHNVMRYLTNRDRLVMHNMRLVYRLARDNSHRSIPLGDLVQEGSAGLVRAAEKYDYRLGYRFSTYAYNWINQYIQRSCQGNGQLINYPSHVHQDINRLHRVRMQKVERTGREPAAEELAVDAGMAIDKVRSLRKLNNITVSLDQPVSERVTMNWAETLPDQAIEDTASSAEDLLMNRLLESRLGKLEDMEQFIVKGRFGLQGGEPLTFRQLADQLGVSTEWARQLEKTALAKLSEDPSLAQAYRYI